jgi:Fur family ferric uptake transcriptional regulator
MSANKIDLTKKCRQLLVDNNIPITRPRILLLEILLENKGPLKVEQVIKLSKGSIAISSLYRVINDLKNLGLISEFQTLENTKVIELASVKGEHHHHIFCKSCGAVDDFEINTSLENDLEQEIQKIESLYNISVLSHSLELLSLCHKCKTN